VLVFAIVGAERGDDALELFVRRDDARRCWTCATTTMIV
jgi:hypothetical protein